MVRLSSWQKTRLDYSGGQLREIRFEYASVCLTIGTVEVDVSAEELDEILADLEMEAGFGYLKELFQEQGYCPELLGYLEAVAKRIVEQARISLAFGRRAA